MAWSLFASHGLVLGYVANHRDATIREISDALGLTERQISRVLRELEQGGMITVEKTGRRNCYHVNEEAPYNHPSLAHVSIGDLVRVMRIPAKEDRPRRTVLTTVVGSLTAGVCWAFGFASEAATMPAM